MNDPTNGGRRGRHRRRWAATGLLVGVPAIVVPYLLFAQEDSSFAQEDSQAATVDGDAYYRLVSVRSGKVLGIAGNSTAQGAAAEQQTDRSATSQEWRSSEVSGSDVVTFASRRSGHVLDISGGSAAQGAAVVRYPRFRHPPRHPARPQQPQSTVHECRYATNCLRDRRS
jgi:hypothetical protein